MTKPKAVIDIGTNSTRLLVAEITGGLTTDLHREARVTRLGQGVDKNKTLAAEAIERTIEVILDYVKICKQFGAENIVIAATSAARDAKNIASFIDLVKVRAGIELKVLRPEQEATLAFLGATQHSHLFPLPSTPFALVLDIGGGSTELILGKKQPELAFSKDIGSVRLTEMFINNDPPLENELEKTANYIKQVYGEPVKQILDTAPKFQMIGTAGTVTTLAALSLGLKIYDPQKIHNSTLSLSSIESLFSNLKKLTIAQRKELKIIQPGRADVIATGALILFTIMRMLNVEDLLVSENDILDGLLNETF